MTRTSDEKTGFWDRAATWKAVLFVVAYLAFYLVVGRVVVRAFDSRIDDDNAVADAASIVLGVALPIAIGAAALLLFAARLGWLREIFGPQPVKGRRWMWIAPVLVLGAIVAHLAGADWDRWSGSELAALAFFGLCVGLTEELATRGITVKMLRDAGHAERYVAVVSSLIFALMHSVNLISGMSVRTVLATVVYTFGFGMCMYLAMRVTGTIWAAILLHGLTDPTTILAVGGLDEAVVSQDGGASAIAVLVTIALVVFGIVAIFLVRGKAGEPQAGPPSPA
ncbi:CPBP family intramembrane metalloprotease [Mumia zhuanghuii]|uniref:CPBP family intramembrane glutamic endopeptidase n=2 Tax=Mumia TaxID=1546255 RepID=A0ABW1QJY0_9ACTN|nr:MULTISPECIES: CPBP family intramembrane glutamic endopeptidase [Mumia]KAA1418213.1 CPBP family intramembrane metalloprotease [Mumia zhuanghuii]